MSRRHLVFLEAPTLFVPYEVKLCVFEQVDLHWYSNTNFPHVCVQMIAAQKQLIENADAVQERVAQVQREGNVSAHEWNDCRTSGSAQIIRIYQMNNSDSTELNEGESSENKSASKQHYTSRDSLITGDFKTLKMLSVQIISNGENPIP